MFDLLRMPLGLVAIHVLMWVGLGPLFCKAYRPNDDSKLTRGGSKPQLSFIEAHVAQNQSLGGKGCIKDLSDRFCCGSIKNGVCKDGSRSPCMFSDASTGMRCSTVIFKGKKCQCRSGMCYVPALNKCVEPESVTIPIGGTSPAKPEVRKFEVRNEDIVEQVFKPANGKTLAKATKFVDEVEHVAAGATNGVVKMLHTALAPVINSLAYGGTRFTGHMARQLLSMDNDFVEKLIQWVLSNFVLTNDDPSKSCDQAAGPLNLASTRPDQGHCHFDLSAVPSLEEPIWQGPLYPYDNGKTGINARKFNISLSAKVGQIRCLEALQVQKSHCYGNLLTEGGFCDLDLSPEKECPLSVTNVEIMIFCEGHCDLGSHAMSLINNEASLQVGDSVYINKAADVPSYWRWALGDRTKYARKRDRVLSGCNSESAKGIISRTFLKCTGPDNPSCIRHCVQAADDGEELGCWAHKNLIPEAGCGWTAAATNWLTSRVARWSPPTAAAVSKRPLLFRKFNVELTDVNVRARLYVHRTRSLQEIVNEQPEDQQEGVARAFKGFFRSANEVLKNLRHPREWALSDRELISQHKINVKQTRAPDGTVSGYELVTCNQPVWNNETQAYDQPPLEKCLKIDLQDLQLLATRSDYLNVEEIASSANPPSGWRSVVSDFIGFYSHGITSLLGYENVGFVLAAVTKLARMMFVRDVVLIQAKHPVSRNLVYCKDKWVDSSKESKAHAVGIKCDATTLDDGDARGSGIEARFDFEIAELPPVWSQEKHRNEVQIAIRGGYNLQFCRVAGESDESGAQAGAVICDVDPPVQENTQLVDATRLPANARFRVHHFGQNASKVVIGAGSAEDAQSGVSCGSDAGRASEDACPTSDDAEITEKVKQGWGDGAAVGDLLKIKLQSLESGKFCEVKMVSYTKNLVLSKTRPMLFCDTVQENPDADGHQTLALKGNIDTLTPSPIYDRLILLSITCAGVGAGWVQGKWGALFGGAGQIYMLTSLVGGLVAGAALGFMAQVTLADSYHLDGIMFRFMIKEKLQSIGQYVLFCVESALVFEFPRP
eukprot:TRINITY_DN20032_c0_g1_i1.p1 TRINITY_DN20032_c0_g1~~TRINITY_DN20032_c0_g1_i1.p1  ORF type:complete len:1056 (+),score=154.45 TRINITY_DN20032_c0_g1_i1:75-3242(+)